MPDFNALKAAAAFGSAFAAGAVNAVAGGGTLISYPTLLIGVGPAAKSLLQRIQTHPESGLRVVGTLADQGAAASDLPLLGGASDLPAVVGGWNVSNIVIGYGGITSSDTATHGLRIRRAWARGTLLPGIVSLWEPVDGPAAGIPYIVFAGNVGGADALVDALDLLRSA